LEHRRELTAEQFAVLVSIVSFDEVEGICRVTDRQRMGHEIIHLALVDIVVDVELVCVVRRVGCDRVVPEDALAKEDWKARRDTYSMSAKRTDKVHEYGDIKLSTTSKVAPYP
jgi:hypothetical protein